MSVNYLTAPLETLTLTQLFARQAQANTTHERALACRNQHPTISAEWDMWNAVLTGSMQDLADIARAITERIEDMRAELHADDEARTFTEGWACTTCGKPVMSISPGDWTHKDQADIYPCSDRRVGPVKARVDA